jgi:hypothetical protein
MAAFRLIRVTFLLASVLLLVVVAAPAAPAENACTRVALDPRPAWLSSLLWLPAPLDRILAVDPALNRLLLYGPDGKGSIVPEPPQQFPALVVRAGDRILLKLVGRDLVSLDAKTLQDAKPLSALKEMRVPELGQPLHAIFQWSGVDKSALLAFGIVDGDNLRGGSQTGLFKVSLAGNAASLLRLVPDWDYYVLGYPYLTSVGTTGFFLEFAKAGDRETVKLYEVSSSGALVLIPHGVPNDERSAYRADFSEVKRVSAAMNGPAGAPALYSKLSKMKMITGIYGDASDGMLYELAREPVENDVPRWWLFRVSPANGGSVLGKVLLPTTAKHVSMVISPGNFYFFERGDAEPLGGQQINTMVTVPSPALRQATDQGYSICPELRQ